VACADVTPTEIAAPSYDLIGATRSVIIFHDTASIPADGIALIRNAGGVVSTRLDSIGVVFATLGASALPIVAGSDLVKQVGTDREVNWLRGVRIGAAVADALPGAAAHQDPTQAGRWDAQWNMRVIQADQAWAQGYFGAPGIKVAILDTGIDYTNREIAGLVDMTLSQSFVPATAAPGDQPFMDDHFHGTHVASSVVSNNITVAGVAPHTTLVAVKVLSAAGSGLFEWITAGIVYAADADANVINMSLGAELHEQDDAALIETMRRAVKYAEKQRTIVISAAGNDAANLDAPNVFYAPCELSTICVSATGPLNQQNFDQPATYTNFGVNGITVAAPGGNSSDTETSVNEDLILGACSTRTTQPTLAPCRASGGPAGYFYAFAAGTSMATPHVAGVAAMILARNPNIPVNALRNKIIHGADDLGPPGRDDYYGHGRVNVYRSLTGG
jgi:subtilisin family serine protease